MSPDLEHALALWRAYDAAVIAERQARAVEAVALSTWHPPKSKRRQLPPECAASRSATLRADSARRAAMNAYHALGLVFDETPNEAAGDPAP